MKKTIIKRIRKAQSKAEGRGVWDRLLVGLHDRYQSFKDRFKNSESSQVNEVYLKTRNLKRNLIVTCRLEKYRQQTEAWLIKHGVRYEELHMWDVPSKSERRGRFARHKIDILLLIKPDIFWESNRDQPQRIWDEIRVPTLCIDNMILLS